VTAWSSDPQVDLFGESGQAFPARDGGEPHAVRRWRAAEGRLYPLITADPALYEAAVTLVGEAAAVLRRRCSDATELEELDTAEVLVRCASTPAVTALGVDPDTALDAARAIRWRELTADHQMRSPDLTSGDPR
jgi:hypothetical protein